MKKIAIIISLLSISGCAQEQVWVNPSKTTQDFYSDRATCNSMSQGVSNPQIYSPPQTGHGNNPFMTGFMQGWNNGSAMNAVAAKNQIFSDCMMGMGWSLQNKEAVSRVQDVQRPETPPPSLYSAIKSIPELNHWYETSSPKFSVAVEADEALKKNPGWQKAPLEYRFKRAYEITKAVYGESANDTEMCVWIDVASRDVGKKGSLAALRMFPDFIVTEKNKECLAESYSGEYNAFIDAVYKKIPDTALLYVTAGK
ncbi:hypothetical protein [Pectobacterium parvum]|uniref:hypothetical protein n=1 Tax=Pectobacterium parvum TaxID=2778550 RepID=UPI002159129A|nr:hypothetical protein [Pectobacterium parvum]UVD99369.1 hypothetical protein NV347_10460 [Pectobacterium parvum]